MAVPSGDQRDYLFSKHFSLPIIPISDTQQLDDQADPTKEGRYINSGIINGMTYREAVDTLIAELETIGDGEAPVTYRMRDAWFGRQRSWGEPVHGFFDGGLPTLISTSDYSMLVPG